VPVRRKNRVENLFLLAPFLEEARGGDHVGRFFGRIAFVREGEGTESGSRELLSGRGRRVLFKNNLFAVGRTKF
jgi:hypothetical protein